MSLRLRAFALIMLIAVSATAATAWLTLREASKEVRQILAADQQQTDRIAGELQRYGSTRLTWDGVQTVVGRLAQDTGQRIRVETDAGQLLADSDLLAGRSPRAVTSAAMWVNARPTLQLPKTGSAEELRSITEKAIKIYRWAVDYATCLTRSGTPYTTRTTMFGILEVVPDYDPAGRGVTCRDLAHTDAGDTDGADLLLCTRRHAGATAPCLTRVFAQRTSAIGPAPLRVHLGAVDDSPAPPLLPVGRTVLLATAISALAALAALLLGRGVLRPVRRLITASRRLGAGDLTQRVPVTGRDEIAKLADSFNRMADSLQAAEDRQRRLTADIAHELRNPLANLRGLVEALQDGLLPPTQAVLASLHEEVLLQQRIVDDLQDLAAAESGTLTYHWSDVNGADLLAGSQAAYRGSADAARVTLTIDIVEPVWFRGDPDRLRQAVGNLVTNAIRATPAGGRVELRLARDDQSVLIDVRDTGSGIADTDLPHLFDRFWRADAARGRDTGGSGLGLAIMRQIVADHGGTVEVTSTVGVGTTFTVRLPGQSVAQPVPRAAPRSPTPGSTVSPGPPAGRSGPR